MGKGKEELQPLLDETNFSPAIWQIFHASATRQQRKQELGKGAQRCSSSPFGDRPGANSPLFLEAGGQNPADVVLSVQEAHLWATFPWAGPSSVRGCCRHGRDAAEGTPTLLAEAALPANAIRFYDMAFLLRPMISVIHYFFKRSSSRVPAGARFPPLALAALSHLRPRPNFHSPTRRGRSSLCAAHGGQLRAGLISVPYVAACASKHHRDARPARPPAASVVSAGTSRLSPADKSPLHVACTTFLPSTAPVIIPPPIPPCVSAPFPFAVFVQQEPVLLQQPLIRHR